MQEVCSSMHSTDMHSTASLGSLQPTYVPRDAEDHVSHALSVRLEEFP